MKIYKIIILVVLLLSSFLFGKFYKPKAQKYAITVIEINGVIVSSHNIIKQIHAAVREKDNKAIILRINSPGGAVGPTQEIFYEVKRIDDMYTSSNGKKGKPIYTSINTMAASGGYYIASATRRIYASRGVLTGSIGVMLKFNDLSGLFNLASVKHSSIVSGKYKDIGSIHREMTSDEKDMLHGLAYRMHQEFINDILSKRKDKIKGDINELAQGQLFTGLSAYDSGLVDKNLGLWAAGREIHTELKLKTPFGFYFQKNKNTMSLRFLFNKAKIMIQYYRSLISETTLTE
jgi:protease IV